jgi:hypothetical protein
VVVGTLALVCRHKISKYFHVFRLRYVPAVADLVQSNMSRPLSLHPEVLAPISTPVADCGCKYHYPRGDSGHGPDVQVKYHDNYDLEKMLKFVGAVRPESWQVDIYPSKSQIQLFSYHHIAHDMHRCI